MYKEIIKISKNFNESQHRVNTDIFYFIESILNLQNDNLIFQKDLIIEIKKLKEKIKEQDKIIKKFLKEKQNENP